MAKTYDSYESWVKLDSKRELTEKERNRMSVSWRVWEVALSRLNNHGHAAFHTDELVKLVCGKVDRNSAQVVHRGIKTLAQMGRIAPEGDKGSTLLCILVNPEIARRDAGKGNYTYLCSEPSHMDMRQEPYSPDSAVFGVSESHEFADGIDPWDE
jgi:hypothetical protein